MSFLAYASHALRTRPVETSYARSEDTSQSAVLCLLAASPDPANPGIPWPARLFRLMSFRARLGMSAGKALGHGCQCRSRSSFGARAALSLCSSAYPTNISNLPPRGLLQAALPPLFSLPSTHRHSPRSRRRLPEPIHHLALHLEAHQLFFDALPDALGCSGGCFCRHGLRAQVHASSLFYKRSRKSPVAA